jgi:hypothetical protein
MNTLLSESRKIDNQIELIVPTLIDGTMYNEQKNHGRPQRMTRDLIFRDTARYRIGKCNQFRNSLLFDSCGNGLQ